MFSLDGEDWRLAVDICYFLYVLRMEEGRTMMVTSAIRGIPVLFQYRENL